MSFKDEMGKMIFNLCCSIWSDQGYYHKLVIFHQNSKYICMYVCMYTYVCMYVYIGIPNTYV